MGTTLGAIFVISMVLLAAAFFYFVLRGAGVAAESAEETVEAARAEAHLPEPGADVTPPATGLLIDEIPGESEPPTVRTEERVSVHDRTI